MDVLTAIYTRQSISKVEPDPLPRQVIEQLLAAAVQAPNHHKVRPWRFVVISGQARQRLGDALAQSLKKQIPDAPEQALEKERSRPLRAPVIIAVAVDHPTQSNIDEIENICAAAAAVENLLLAAHSMGLGAIWRTGKAAANPDIKTFLGFEPDQHLIALIYLGYPRTQPDPVQRPGFQDRTVWLED